MKMASSEKEILERDEEFIELTKGSILVPGSLTKISCLKMDKWGIQITPDNREFVKERGRFFGRKDEIELARLDTADVEGVLSTDQRKTAEARMATTIGKIVDGIVRSLDDGRRKFDILDFGARLGKATSAIASRIALAEDGGELLGRTKFHLIEPSADRAKTAMASLSYQGLCTSMITTTSGLDADSEYLLEKVDDNSIDLLVMLSSAHHNSFPEYMEGLFRVLKPGGVLVDADWFSDAWNDPEFGLLLLRNLGADSKKCDAYRKFFGIEDSDMKRLPSGSSPSHISEDEMAIVEHMIYWDEIGTKLRGIPPQQGKPLRRYFLGGHTTVLERMSQLKEAGFHVDMAEIARVFPRANLPILPKKETLKSNFAVVLTGMKPKLR